MALEAKCPKCATVFDPSRHRAIAIATPEADAGISKPPEDRTADAARVKCPKCGFEFFSVSLRLFVGPRVVLAIAIGVVVAVAIIVIGGFAG